MSSESKTAAGEEPMYKAATPSWLAFAVAWIAYGSTYLLRKPVGVIKATYSKELSLSNSQLGGLDMAMLSSYALFQMLLGTYADRLGPRRTLSLCLFGSGIAMAPFVIFYKYPAFLVMLFICGAFQSFCWAACNTGLSGWWPDKKKRQTVLGYFGTSPFIGGILGTVIAYHVMKRFGWRRIYTIPAIVNMVCAVVTYLLFKCPTCQDTQLLPGPVQDTSRKFSFVRVARSPGMIACSLAVSCLKIVRYGMYFWLPLYFERALDFSPAYSSYLSILFDIGAAVGSLTAGMMLRLLFRQNSLAASSTYSGLSALSLSLFVGSSRYTAGPWRTALSMILIALTGALNGGPDILLCSVVPLEVAPPNTGNAFVGFVNGLGSVGGAIEGPLIGFIADKWSLQGALVTMICFSLLAAACCVRTAWAIKSAKNTDEE